MADVAILKAAADDYTAALRWYAERSIAAAAGFETAISQAIEAVGAWRRGAVVHRVLRGTGVQPRPCPPKVTGDCKR
jgi:plasmid stabilization system protein ParE